MKKNLIALILCMVLCTVSFITPASARITNAQKAYAMGGIEALWELVSPRYNVDRYVEAGCAELCIYTPNGPAFATQYSDEFRPQTFYRVMMQETAGVGFTLEQVITIDTDIYGNYFEGDETANVLRDGPVHIDPCGSFSYNAGCPSSGNMRYQIIVAAGKDDNGHELEFYGIAQRLNIMADVFSIAADPDHDTENLRYAADFKVEVADGVWWVPVSALGGSRYTNREIAGMVEHTPEEKQEEISTLYEALQLYQISNFAEGDDNVRIREGKIDWEHHKPGYDAVRTNNGCCATDSNWLNYILRGDYEQVGFIAYSQADGSGHVFNYIFRDGWYYFVDLTHYRTDFLDAAGIETGNMTDYRNSDIVAGNLHKVKEPEDYVKYCIDVYNDPPSLFFIYQADDCLPLDGVNIDGQMTITYPEGYDIKVMDGKNPSKLDYAFVKGPKKKNNWTRLKNAKFTVDEKYLTPGDETIAAEPATLLSAYKPGDKLSLTDYGQESGIATIDGIDFSVCKTDSVWFSFEPDVFLYGGNYFSYFDYEIPLGRHNEAMKEIDSLVLGELIASFVKKIPEVQMVICRRNGDKLTVEEVLDGQYYLSRQLALEKNTNGQWENTPEYWYLMISRDGNTLYQFGRIRCCVTH